MMASTVDLSRRKDPSKSDGLCDRFVTGNPEIDNWIWIIEYFAKFKTELWMLHDVFEMGPKLPDYLGEHTNEMVAFRCLASLFDSSTIGCGESKDVVSDAKSKIEFDSSENCEYVLQCILDEIPLSELKPGAPGLSKWNLLPFIKRKLLCLPKCALELMTSEKDTEVSPCTEQECMRIDGKETDQASCRMACPEPTGRIEDIQSDGAGPGDGADEINRSHTFLERSNHGPGDGGEISRSQTSLERRDEGVESGSDGHVSSPSENRYICIQCKGSGKLLFCSGDDCTVMVHEKCVVDSPPVYDDIGNFYCFMCAFSCVSAEYLQSQEEVAKAKKKLVLFFSLMSKVNKKKAIEGSSLSCIKPYL